MRVSALLLIGSLTIATAQAQSEDENGAFLPMPKTLPMLLFAPDSLAGSMLEPLEVPRAAAHVAVANDDPTTVLQEAVGDAQLRPAAVTEAEPGSTEKPTAEAESTIKPATSAQSDVLPEPETAAVEPDAVETEAAPAAEEAAIEGELTTVHVIVENVESDAGTVNVAVCNTAFTPDGCPYHVAVPASAGFVEAMFDDVPPGIYAVVGYHDVNNNDEFDRFLGIPREPYAMSGEAGDSLVPAFSDAVLDINQGENYVIIRMKRLGSG